MSGKMPVLSDAQLRLRNACVYECPTPDRLLIVLTGVEDDKARELRFDLKRQR